MTAAFISLVEMNPRIVPAWIAVLVIDAPAPDETQPMRVRLIITANYDAGRTGLAYHPSLRSGTARLTHRSTACPRLARLDGARDRLAARHLGAPDRRRRPARDRRDPDRPAAALADSALAFLVDLAAANPGPAANDNASGAAVALALASALDAAPPPGVAVDVLLQGAGEGGSIGLRRYLRAHRTELRPADTVVLGIGPSGDGRPSWWHSDGRLVPLRYAPALRELSGRVATDEPHLRATRTADAARPPPTWPARGVCPRSRSGPGPTGPRAAIAPVLRSRRPARPDALDRASQFGLLLADAIGAFVQRERAGRPSSTPA